VVEAPVAMTDAARAFELREQWSAGVGREDVKRGALEAVLFDPLDGGLEHARVVVIAAEDEAAVHLDAVVVEDRYAPRVVVGCGRALARVLEIARVQRFEADKDAHAAGQRHLAHQSGIVRYVDREGGAPDDSERGDLSAELAQVLGPR